MLTHRIVVSVKRDIVDTEYSACKILDISVSFHYMTISNSQQFTMTNIYFLIKFVLSATGWML